MTLTTRSVALVLVAVMLTATPVVGVAGATPGSEGATAESVAEPIPQTATPTPTDNESTQHENPDDVDEEGDTDSVRRWLEGRLGRRLSENAIRIDEGQYEQGRNLLGDDYDGLLGNYVEVAGDTDGGEETTQEFEDARDEQRELANRTEEYRETVRQYREARQNGNETRARRLARESNRLAEDINRTAGDLNRTYRRLENQTSVDLTDAIGAVGDLRTNVTTQQAQINRDLFVRTALSASARRPAVSFLNPTTVTGAITLENGTVLANRTVSLRIGGRTVTVTTDADGRFSTNYRPTIAPLGRQNVTVRYLPRNESVYLASNDTISVDISQTRTDINLDATSQKVGFGDTLSVGGRVSVDGIGAGTVPVAVVLDGVRLGTVRTAPDGNFTADIPVPAGVRDGSRTLRVRVPLEDRALAPANATRQVTVESTATTLNLSSETRDDAVRASGQLQTRDGRAVAGQQITLLVGGNTVATARTDDAGRFTATVPASQLDRPERQTDSVTLTAEYANQETNLESARATTSVPVTASQSAGESDNSLLASLFSFLSTPGVWLGGVVVLVGLVVAFVRYRDTSEDDDGGAQSDDAPTVSADQPPTAGATDQLLATAREQLESGDADTAVETAYAAVRRQSASLVEVSPGSTHWEWYAACERAGLDGERLDTVRKLTEWYEQAAFAPETLDSDSARSALTSADSFTPTDPATAD